MDTEELLVHDCSQRKAAEGLHTCFINLLGVLVFAFELEGKVVGQMSTFVVSAEKPQGVWIPYFQ
jgi:hypothetical protein